MLYYLCLNTQLKALLTFLSLFLKQYVSVYLSLLLLTLCSQTHWQLLLGSKQHVFRWGSVKFPSTGLQRCYCCICMLLYLVKLLKTYKYLMNACRSKTTQKLHSQHYVSLNDTFPVLGDIMSSKITNNRTEEDH